MKKKPRFSPADLKSYAERDWGLPERLRLEESVGFATGDDAEEILRRADELKRSAQ